MIQKALILFTTFLITSNVYCQDYKYHPVFLYSFSKYIEWPESARQDKFVITIVGSNEAYLEVKNMIAKKDLMKGKSIEVYRAKNFGEIPASHIVFITNSFRFTLDQLKKQFSNKPVLLITEHPGIGDHGAHINFITVGGKISFELNKTLALDHGFRVAHGLEMLAAKVY